MDCVVDFRHSSPSWLWRYINVLRKWGLCPIFSPSYFHCLALLWWHLPQLVLQFFLPQTLTTRAIPSTYEALDTMCWLNEGPSQLFDFGSSISMVHKITLLFLGESQHVCVCMDLEFWSHIFFLLKKEWMNYLDTHIHTQKIKEPFKQHLHTTRDLEFSHLATLSAVNNKYKNNTHLFNTFIMKFL